MAYAMVSTVRPKASDTPSRPIPTLGNAAARTALPQPPKTSQNVPKNSAARIGSPRNLRLERLPSQTREGTTVMHITSEPAILYVGTPVVLSVLPALLQAKAEYAKLK